MPILNLNLYSLFTISMPMKDPFKISATFCKSSAVIALPFPNGEKNVFSSLRHVENVEFVMLNTQNSIKNQKILHQS